MTTRGPENSIDGVLDSESRWSNESMGTPKHLTLDLVATQALKLPGVTWYKGDSRKSAFSIQASTDGTNFETTVPARETTGTTLDFEPFEFDAVQVRYVRIEGNGNGSNSWNSVEEIAA
ncbi:discoidin domain-containing protein [Epibacterium ulvae]|uniref:discoidin domain-containing protein n=1 Tax=Epibacterium ulvae TaxID=1156985 RepID=UPI001BFC5DC0|nr:discoidin domain-containing protein [Epibacterium ulvae]MBT8153465.1 discoidin domain-containing protein [Epibacterium ulvae]